MVSSSELFNEGELKTEILKTLDQTETPGSFACHGKVGWAVNPGLDIQGLGLVGLPLSTRETEIIIEKCRKSPFGKGDKTLVDDSVRRSWELNPTEFELINPAWLACMDQLLSTVHFQLGLTCARANIAAELYKLLIYEPGAFFKPHQDSEKTPGMFGTMVVSLPSQHQGGKVVLTHNKRKVEFDTSAYTPFDTAYGAWYSDVFHEVEKVTTGHRVVLTFNLVQKQPSITQRAPETDSKARLKRALEAWEHASISGAPDIPPYLVHKLDHQYSEESLYLAMLKGKDYTQVRFLHDACQEERWEIYLATHEKTLTGDDYYDVEEFDREDDFKHIVKLDGRKTGLKPNYDRSCYLNDEESGDEAADESEHEGYTGNEGAPATFWYRKSVALLVPPSRTWEFGFTPQEKNKAVLGKLGELNSQASNNPAVNTQMYDLCNIVLQAEVTPSVWPSYSRFGRNEKSEQPSCEKEIARIALEQDWLDIFDRVPVSQKTGPEVIERVGRYLRGNGVSKLTKSMNGILHELASISAKHSMLEKITEAFKSGEQSGAQQNFEDGFDQWYSSAIKDILDTKERASADDGEALAKIAKASTVDISAQILLKLDIASTKTVAAFVIEFAKDNSDLTLPLQRRYLEAALDKLWSGFTYSETFTERNHPWVGNRTRVENVDLNILGPLLAITKDYCDHSNDHQDSKNKSNRKITLPSALRFLSDATCKAGEIFLCTDLMTFVSEIVSHKIPALIVDDADADGDLFDALSHFILTVITFAIRLQGPEPAKPKDWSLPSRSCGCQSCEVIAKFMRDPQRSDISYPVKDRVRKHLDDQYLDTYHGMHLDRSKKTFDYTIGVDKSSGTPYKWTCRKEHFTYKKKHQEWNRKRDKTRALLQQMDGGKHAVPKKTKKKTKQKSSSSSVSGGSGGGVLSNWLGEHYEAIMECRVEQLPMTDEERKDDEERRKEEDEDRPKHGWRKPLGILNPTSVNERSGGPKRGLEEDQDSENVKRARLDPEVIDLT